MSLIPSCLDDVTPDPAAMSEQDLAAIASRLAAATPGPWHEKPGHEEDDHGHLLVPDGREIAYIEWGECSAGDPRFIEYAWQDVSALLAEVRRLRGTP